MALPFAGTVAIRAMKDGDYQAIIFAGTQAGLQAALDYCAPTSVTSPGGHVRVGPGTITLTSPLTIYGNTILEGSGRYTTWIEADASFSGSAMITNADQAGGMQWCAVENLSVEGGVDSGATVAYGIYFKGIGQPSRIRDVHVNRCSGIGIYLEGIAFNGGPVNIYNTNVSHCNGDLIVLTGRAGGYTIEDVHVQDILAGKAGILLDGPIVSFYPTCIKLARISVEEMAATAMGIHIDSARNVHVRDVLYVGSGSTGDLIKISGAVSDLQGLILENISAQASSCANGIVDTPHSYTLANGADGVNVTRYDAGYTKHQGTIVFRRSPDQASATTLTPGIGNILHLTGGTTLDNIATSSTEAGRVIVVWFAAATTVRDQSVVGGAGNIFIRNSNSFRFAADDTLTLFSTGTNWIEVARSTGAWGTGPSITAAATIAIPGEGNVFHVTGNTNITNGITVDSARDAGRIVTLIFDGTPTVSDTGTSRLSAAFIATADDTLTLACDGTNWYEVARSAN